MTSTARKPIKEIGERENIDQVFLLGDKQLRANRAGNLYLQLRLVDKTGSLTAMLWNASEKISEKFNAGDFVNVKGATQFHNGGLQLIATHVDKAPEDRYDESEFVTLDQVQIDKMLGKVSELLRAIKNVHLRNLAECFLVDEDFISKLTAAPAGIKNHHAYRGGLLDHIHSLMTVCSLLGGHYPDVDQDLLMIGAFLHDAAKIRELSFDREFAYTDEGQLIGHLVIGLELVQEKIAETEKLSNETFPEELALRLKHMIISHHGEYEFGSPKLPMTPEAIALHYLDTLDAKLHTFTQLIREDVSPEPHWTTYQPSMGRKVFKGSQS